jgi:hydroxyacylglutathione hydrolase
LNLVIQTYTLGLMENNAYLLFDPLSREAIIIDPPFGSEPLMDTLKAGGLNLQEIWITHAHFDHMAGVNILLQNSEHPLKIGLHPADMALWQSGGGADHFAIRMEPCPPPDILFSDGDLLHVGEHLVKVLHAPGHTPGHVMFYSAENSALICGDVIFQGNIGRTDLPGGDPEAMVHSLQTQVIHLPGNTRLLPGHGPESTVEEEILSNPFLFILS